MHAQIPIYLIVPQRRPTSVARAHHPDKTASARSARRSLFRNFFWRREPTTFQRCLAVHMHFAARNSGLE